MLGFVHSVRLNMTRLNGCSSPCLTHGITPLHLGVSPSNRGLGMPYPRYVPCPLFAHSQLYLTPLTLSCPLLSHNRMLPTIFCTCFISLSVNFCEISCGRGDCASSPYRFGSGEYGQCCIHRMMWLYFNKCFLMYPGIEMSSLCLT